MKKKSKKGQGPKVKSRSPSIPPEERVPDEWKKLVPDYPDISLPDVLNNADDTMALQVANKPSMEELVKQAKEGDEKLFFDLIKIHTSVHPFDSEEDSILIIPSVSADRGFYEQEWVQKILKKKMQDKRFRELFWKAAFSRQNGTLFKSTANELKRYISLRKNEWTRLGVTTTDIKKELQNKKLLSRELRAKGTLEKFLERCGVKRPKARGRPKKKNTT